MTLSSQTRHNHNQTLLFRGAWICIETMIYFYSTSTPLWPIYISLSKNIKQFKIKAFVYLMEIRYYMLVNNVLRLNQRALQFHACVFPNDLWVCSQSKFRAHVHIHSRSLVHTRGRWAAAMAAIVHVSRRPAPPVRRHTITCLLFISGGHTNEKCHSLLR